MASLVVTVPGHGSPGSITVDGGGVWATNFPLKVARRATLRTIASEGSAAVFDLIVTQANPPPGGVSRDEWVKLVITGISTAIVTHIGGDAATVQAFIAGTIAQQVLIDHGLSAFPDPP